MKKIYALLSESVSICMSATFLHFGMMLSQWDLNWGQTALLQITNILFTLWVLDLKRQKKRGNKLKAKSTLSIQVI